MKNKRYIFVFFILSSFFVSCEDFLTIVPKDQLSEENVFASENGADLYLNDIYVTLPNPEIGGDNGRIKGQYTWDSWDWMSPYNFSKFTFAMSSKLYPSHTYTSEVRNPGLYNNDYPSVNFIYDRIVPYIRNCNFFIEAVERNKENFSSEWKTIRIAEAKCLRTYYYHLLWMNYGGVPYITKVLDNNTMGEEIFQPSMSQKDMFIEMQKELSEAAKVLPNEQGEGRFTKGAALALKAWIELYWGDIIKDPRPSTIFSADLEMAKKSYESCANTCQEIMGLGIYDLMETRSAVFEEKNNNCKEQIFAYQCNSNGPKSQRSSRFGPYNATNGNVGDVGTGAPTQALVDMYGMANGLPITDPLSGYDKDNPYVGREPRFYQDIVYDGCIFADHKFSLKPNIPAGDVNLVPIDGQLFSGYFRRKGINESLNSSTFVYEACNFTFFRYAEVLLMYAEARIKEARLGGRSVDQTVIDAIDKVRMRPATVNDNGLPSLETTYGSVPSLEKLEEIIYNERIVELAFEFKAYNDVIRYRKGAELMNQPKYGVRKDDTGKYIPFELYKGDFNNDKYYLMPIYRGWLENNPVWIHSENQVDGRKDGQNPGW